MSFEDFLADSVDSRIANGTFRHSTHTVPKFDKPTDDQAKEAIARAVEIQREIGAKFDADYLPCVARMNEMFAEADTYLRSGTLQPLPLYQSQCYMLGHLVTICQDYQNDADTLAKLGAPGFQTYLKKLFDDASGGLAQLRKATAAGMRGPSLDAAEFLATLKRDGPASAGWRGQPGSAPGAPVGIDPTRGPMWGFGGQPGPAMPGPGTNPLWPFVPSPPLPPGFGGTDNPFGQPPGTPPFRGRT